MNQRETVARALARVEYDSDEDFEIAVDSGHAPSCEWYRYVDAVLAALGLGEGGENVVVPRSAVSKCPFDADDMDMDEPCPVCGVTGHAGLDAVMAKCVGYARPQAGEAGE